MLQDSFYNHNTTLKSNLKLQFIQLLANYQTHTHISSLTCNIPYTYFASVILVATVILIML